MVLIPKFCCTLISVNWITLKQVRDVAVICQHFDVFYHHSNAVYHTYYTTVTVYSRDRLLSLQASMALHNRSVRLQVSQLGLCRRGCHAGMHWCHCLLAARSVTSLVKRTCTSGEIPTIIGRVVVMLENGFQTT